MAPIVHGLEAEFSGKVAFHYLDIDDPATKPVKEALGYRYQPHLFLIDAQGNILQQWLGIVDEAVLRQSLAAAAQ